MHSFTKIDSEGRVCELRLLTPVQRDEDTCVCELVVLIDGVERKRKPTYGVDAEQARRLAMDLFNLYKSDLEQHGTL